MMMQSSDRTSVDKRNCPFRVVATLGARVVVSHMTRERVIDMIHEGHPGTIEDVCTKLRVVAKARSISRV